jgi:hypothetical protein
MKIRIIRRNVTFSANVQELNQGDVVSRIGAEAYRQIKASDPHPMFVELEVGREGESWGAVLLGGVKKSMRKVWGRARIQELASYLNRGVPLLFGHGATNDQAGRDKVGRTIKGWVEEGGKAVAKAIAYVPSTAKAVQEMIKSKVMDICSIEADLQFAVSDDEGVGLIVDRVLSLTGVAMGRGGVDGVPGFAGAGVIGAVQEMAKLQDLIGSLSKDLLDSEVEIVDQGGGKGRRGGRMGAEALTVGQVRAWIADTGIGPEKLFGLEDLLGVGGVKEAVEAEVQERMQAAEADRGKELDALKAEVQKRDGTIKEKDALVGQYQERLKPFEMQSRQQRLEDIVKKSDLMKGAADPKTAFVVRRLAAALPADLDLSKDESGLKVEAAIKQELKDIEDLHITFAGGNGNGQAGAEGKAQGEVDAVARAKAMMDAGINPLDRDADARFAALSAKK